MALNSKKRPKIRLQIAIPLMLVVSFFMALIALLAKISATFSTTSSLLFWRNAISLVLLLPWLRWAPPRTSPVLEKLKTKEWKLHLIRGLSGFFSVYLFFYSLNFLDLTSATVLWNTMPIFVPLVVLAWHRIPIYHNLWWAIGISFVGILLILQPGTDIFQSAALIPLLAGIFGAVALVSLRSGHYSEPSWRLMFYLFVISIICSGLSSLFSFESSWKPLTLEQLGLLISIGVLGFFYQLTLTFALKFAPIRLLSPFLYLSMIFTLLFDKEIWNVSFSTLTLIGFFCVLAGVFLTVVLYPKEGLK
jgi:drug/metabolite transporter (DMT)-like permease